MRYLSMFSGIDAASVAWEPLGWEPAAFCEVDPFPSAVLAHRFPHVPNLGDVTKANFDAIGPVDLAVFGSPCQSFSVAGKRLGLDDPRGNLALYALSVVARLRPRWFLFENVPGLLSSGDGRDFGQFLATVGECGYQCAWRVLDAQHFGVPQRRRRVFVVGYSGDWRRAAAVLFERHSLQGHPAPRREARQVAPTVPSHRTGGGDLGTDFDCDGGLIAQAFGGNNQSGPIDVATAVNAHGGPHGRLDFESETFIANSLRAEGFDASEDGTGRGTPLVPTTFRWQAGASQGVTYDEDVCGTLIKNQTPAVVHSAANRSNPKPGDPCHPLAAEAHAPAIAYGDQNARSSEADAAAVLRALRDAVGAEAVAEWGSRILDPLQRPEVLRAWLHGGSVRRAAGEGGAWLDDSALARAESLPAGALREVWEHGPDGRSPQGRELAKQLAGQLGTPLPLLPPERTPRSAVRRLTPREAERLQGFPDDWTLIPYRGKPAADGPRYKALGNSMAVPVMRWIGERIAMVDSMRAAA